MGGFFLGIFPKRWVPGSPSFVLVRMKRVFYPPATRSTPGWPSTPTVRGATVSAPVWPSTKTEGRGWGTLFTKRSVRPRAHLGSSSVRNYGEIFSLQSESTPFVRTTAPEENTADLPTRFSFFSEIFTRCAKVLANWPFSSRYHFEIPMERDTRGLEWLVREPNYFGQILKLSLS